MTATLDTTAAIVNDMPEAEYHARPEFSASGAKAILKSPAHFAWQQINTVHKDAYDVGTAVHAAVLGTGWPIAIFDFDSWRTKEAKEAKEAARAEGKVPFLAHEYHPITRMAAAVLAHPGARKILERPGVAEASAFATDPESGVALRSRFDYLPAPTADRTEIGELKTSVSADPNDFDRICAKFGYDVGGVMYPFVLKLARGDMDALVKFIVVETSAPHLVSVNELDAEFEAIGRQRMRRAIDTYARCMESGEWAGYGDETHLIGPPRWLAYQEGMEIF